jgi:S1-C subfamily serine protease/Flp pilus assembly protein TadD
MKKSFCLALITCSSLLLIPTACNQKQLTNHNQSALAAEKLSTESIQQTAWRITVKITVNLGGFGSDSSEKSGSGVLIAKSGNIYTVVTNAHVIGDEKYSFQIKTFDGKTHSAELKNIKSDRFGQKDLALLQFETTEQYTPASLGDPKQVTPDRAVFASGFADDEAELTFSSGKIGQISQKPLMGGYQIGFTNTTKQGMSGGALLNEEGKVIGILGLGAAAILDNAYTYADGSRPDPQMLEKLRANSFAVPVTQLATSIASQQETETQERADSQIIPSKKYTGLPGKIDAIAQEITVRIDSQNNGNGSGVIVAHEGDTYYVVTAGHVVQNEDDYTIVTPDGQSYPIENSTIKTSEETDLAVVQFTSLKSYSTATIADYLDNPDYRKLRNPWIFVSGFPGNQSKINLTGGQFAETGNWAAEMAKDSYSLTNGNGLLYKNTSLPGMSGGAVLDSQGRLIGINTGAENEYYVDAKTGQYAEVALGYSLGISSNNLLNLAKLTDLPATALKQENSLPLELTDLESNSIKEQLFAFKTPEKNATETDWLNYGNQLWRASEDEKAVAAFDRAIALNPQEYRAYYGKGLASSWLDKKKEKIDAFKQATKLNPDFYAAWQALAFNLSFAVESEITKNLLESLAAYNRAIQLEPKIFSNYIRRGDVLKRLKRYDEAIASYDQSIKLQPDSLAYQGKVDVYLELENYQAAIASYDRWIKLQPDAHAYQGKADVYLEKLENYQAAIDNYNQAKKLDPLLDNSTTNHGIAAAYIKLKNYQSAIAILSQAIEKAKFDDGQGFVHGGLYLLRGNAYGLQ